MNLTSLFEPRRDRVELYVLLGLCLLCVLGHLWIGVISAEFTYGRSPQETPTALYMALASALAIVCISTIPLIRRLAPTWRLIGLIFIIGLTVRLCMFGSTPVLEDDWHRYLWDGAVVANGGDPYQFAPADATPVTRLGEINDWSDDPDLLRIQDLSEEDFETYWRINYPYLKTIYPPVAQAAFALGYIVSPFDLNGWRAVLLVFDISAFALLVLTLRLYGHSPLWATLYWWNPVVTLEVFNAGHMDGLIVPFLIGVLALAKLRKPRLAVFALSVAAAVKLWPALLAPALVRKWMFRPLPLAGFALLFLGAALFLMWPQLQYVLSDPDQGLVAYGQSWRRHAFLFSALADGPFRDFADPDRAARNISGILMVLGTLFLAYRSEGGTDTLPETMLLTTALLLFLSPTGYPWYQVWIAAFIPFAPRYGALALMVFAPIYYMRFLLGDSDAFYQWVLVPIAFGIPILLFAVEPLLGQKRSYAQSKKPAHIGDYSRPE
ncbi:MAG: glycosyltransferase family 87 protein [Pseudomonadota bacterium]